MIQQFKPMKLKFMEEIPKDTDNTVFQMKIDGMNGIVDVELPRVTIYHARDDVWHNRTYQYPDLIKEIRNGSLADHKTYIGELTVFDEQGVGRRNLIGHRLCENPFQIQRVAKLYPVRFFPHHITRDKEETLFHLTYGQILEMLKKDVRPMANELVMHVMRMPTFSKPDELLKLKDLNPDGIVGKNLNGVYLRGKTSDAFWKKKFLKELVVKFISYDEKDVGINLFTDENIEVHFADPNRIPIAIANIEEKGMVMAEITYLERTQRGMLRDARVKRLLTEKKEEL